MGLGWFTQNRKPEFRHSVIGNIILGHPRQENHEPEEDREEITELCTNTASRLISRQSSAALGRGKQVVEILKLSIAAPKSSSWTSRTSALAPPELRSSWRQSNSDGSDLALVPSSPTKTAHCAFG